MEDICAEPDWHLNGGASATVTTHGVLTLLLLQAHPCANGHKMKQLAEI